MSECKSYMPSNGTEGEIFISNHCAQCRHEKFYHTGVDGHKKCKIFTSSLIEDSIPEWVYDENDKPTCTRWEYWNWGRDDGDGGLNEPPEPIPYNPNQLLLFEEPKSQLLIKEETHANR